MKTLYYDCFAGISGDMAVGALIDVGADISVLEKGLKGLPLSGYDLRIARDSRRGITGTRFEVLLSAATQPPRSYQTIRDLIGRSDLSDQVRRTALDIFHAVAAAEGVIHNQATEDVHFHEIGAVDSIVDIVGYALCLDNLKIEKIAATPPELGAGTTAGGHGLLPVPAPATLEILKGIPIRIGGVRHEATTPTGAAILAATVHEFTDRLALVPERIGYGVGRRDPEIPNVLRAVLGETSRTSKTVPARQDLSVLECTLDDMNPEFYGHILDRVFNAGAFEAFLVPVIMKKSRPGINLTVLCRPELDDTIESLLLEETTTLGVRKQGIERRILDRTVRTVSTPLGPVRVKEAWKDGRTIRVKPEFEDCRKLAEEHGLPLEEVYRIVRKATEGSA